ncbi:MAG: hypothetical protein JWN52_5276 [Actinomycetia bacterium]|nr:hypothetical protein [Actinomycetes bacterium]
MKASPELARNLIRLIVDLTWFFDSSDDDVVNLDDAVKQTELIGHCFGEQSEEDRQVILAVVAEMVDEAPSPGAREFLEDLPVAMGLVGTDDG